MRISDWSSDVCSSDLARTHGRHPRAVCEPGGFHGAFTGREWAMRTAEERGYEAVLQLDDNVTQFGPIDATRTTYYRDIVQPADSVRVLVEIAMSTNLWMRSEEHTSELQSLMRISYAVFCLKKK